MDSAALDPRLRNPEDSSISVAPALPVSASTPPKTNGSYAATSSTPTPSNASSPDLHRQATHAYPLQPAFSNNNHPDQATPPSATAVHPDDTLVDHDGSGVDPKKPRACEACRGLKVRCEPDPNNPEGACKRCAKAGRNCIITQPTRKRQKKTDSRVAELEKKIDALTATLSATKAGQPPPAIPGGVADGTGGYAYGGAALDSSGGWSAVNGAMSRDAMAMARAQNQSPYGEGNAMAYPPPMVLAGQKRKYTEPRGTGDDAPTPPIAPSAADPRSHEYSDIVDRGIISSSKASDLWDRYNYQMVPHLPAVVFPADMTVGELRKTKPILFLAIMAAASSETPNVQRVLVKELMQVFADKIFVAGEKSIELVQALSVSVAWYWPPEHFEELKFYELVHMAMIMAIDLGLGKRKPRRGGQKAFRDLPFRKHPPPDPTTIEARRTWLACYFMTTNTAMALHRPFLLRWTSFMAECVDVLESSPEAAPTDKYFCHLVWTHQLAEEIGFQFCMDDPSVSVNLSDHMTQHRVRGFERELEKHKKEVPSDLMQPALKFGFHTLNLYMHELALQSEPADAFKAPFAAESLRDSLVTDAPLTPAYTNALAACLTAIDGIFDTFLSMDPASIRCLPVFNFVRVAYATVVLIRIYFAASSPNSELGKIIDKDSMKVEQHLHNLLEQFRVTAAGDRSRPASKFLVVLVMIKSWFFKISKGELRRDALIVDAANAAEGTSAYSTPRAGGDRPASGNATTPGQSEFPAQASSNPLQLLSEAATNNQATANNAQARGTASGLPRGSNGNMGHGAAWFNSPTSFMQDTTSQKPNGGGSSAMPPPPHPQAQAQAQPQQHGQVSGAPAPWLNFGTDFDYSNLGDGFAQAWDMTLQGLGDGNGGLQDFNGISIMAADPLFGSMMGEMPGSDMFQF